MQVFAKAPENAPAIRLVITISLLLNDFLAPEMNGLTLRNCKELI